MDEVAALLARYGRVLTQIRPCLGDREADVLYLWSGKPRTASDDASPEGHYLQFGQDGSLIAITIVNARWLLEQDGKIVVTLSDGRRLETTDLDEVLAAA